MLSKAIFHCFCVFLDRRFRDIALALQESPNINLYCMRIGGTKADIELEQATSGGKLYIQPQFEDAENMNHYAMNLVHHIGKYKDYMSAKEKKALAKTLESTFKYKTTYN